MRKHVVLMVVLAVMVLSMVTACGTKYTHSTKPSSQFAKDERDCEAWAQKEATRKAKAGQSCVVCEEVDRCLVQQKGWKVVR